LRWQIRHDDGSNTGPTDIETLRRWAAEGRITATCGLSRDGQTWLPAASLPELEMDWLVLVSSDSVIGPFAFAALEILRASGDIPPDAHIFRRQAAQLAGSQGTQLVQRTIAAEAHRREAEAQLQQLRANLAAKDLDFDAERQQLAAETARVKAELLRKDAEIAALRDASAQLTTSSEQRQELEARLVDDERETARLRDECDDLRRQVAAANEARDAARQAVQNAHADLRTQLEEALRQTHAIRSQYEARTRRFSELAESLRELACATPLPALPEPVAQETPLAPPPVAGREPMADASPRAAETATPDAPPRPDFHRRSVTGATAKLPSKDAAEPTPEPAQVAEVLPPERPRTAARPQVGNTAGNTASGLRLPHLANLEAQAQQELARLKASKGEGAAFWNRRKSPV
jgi:hypothetical protein